MEGTRRIDEWTRIRDKIPNLDVIVRFSDQPYERAKSVNLTQDRMARLCSYQRGGHNSANRLPNRD